MNLPAGPGLIILDCLSLYVANLLIAGYKDCDNPYLREPMILSAVEKLLSTIEARSDLQVVAVTNEVGWGVVPDTPLGRAYRDLLGMANQSFADSAATVWLMCAGLKLRLK
jgi:adenosylcobinamide kinase/adenosylcobinamide-phosphate guanylyltransferase